MDPWPFPRLEDHQWLVGDGQDDALRALRSALRAVLVDRETAVDGSLPSLLAGLSAAADLSERVQWAVLALTGEARAAGATWAEIGAALGVSKQAAQQRYGPWVQRALAEARAEAPQD